jgi:CheY-like chemotaxis protein
VPKTLLAVDDSATMRKVLEITFAGEDFRVIAADGSAGALARMSDEPVAVVIDSAVDGDGYSLAKEVRARDARAAIVLLSSRYTPFDAGRGKDSGVDDFIDKPFDTQALIDKVKKAIVARETAKSAVAAPTPAPFPSPAPAPVVPSPAPTAPAMQAAPAPHVVPPFGASPRPPVVSPNAPRPNFPTQRTHTLSFEGAQNASPPAQPPVSAPPAQPVAPISRTAPSGLPIVAAPRTSPLAQTVTSRAPDPPRAPEPPVSFATAPAAAPAAPSPVAAAVNGQLAGKLGDLGLSQAQVEAVLALSREVVERVVWEVVPQLAETMIKEEITRLTKEG